MLTLRPYQQDVLNKIKADWQAGYTDLLAVLATGAGKTAIFLALIHDVLTTASARFVILAHTRELVHQPLERLSQYYPALAHLSGVVMADQDDCDRQIIAGTVQTLDSDRRLERVLEHGPVDYVITDEAHHCLSDSSYDRIITALRAANPQLRHLGVTATPLRADGRGMAEMYQKVSAQYGIKELIKLGYLVPPRVLAIQTGISLSGVTTANGDYTNKGLHNVYETANCFDLVVESHRKYAGERQAMAFTATVDGAYELAESFNGAGISAAAADGTTRNRERHNVLSEFRSGSIQVLVNAQLWSEGVDIPQISAIHMVRPTKSDTAYIQRLGRALRPVPGKEDALILDYCPLEARNIVMAGDVLGVPAKKDAYLAESTTPGEVVGGFTFDGNVRWLDGSPMELISRQLDYLNLSPWVWAKDKAGYMVLGLGDGNDGKSRTLVMSPVGETMTLWVIESDRANRECAVPIARHGDLESLTEWAEEYANRHGNSVLARKQAGWRSQPATESQIKFARRLGVWQKTMSKGQCAQAITQALALRTLRQGGYA